ncbi:hypothetical protein [Acuticoccus kandeliae]|uniref:hypothetical protein n=1 Tax=Acuticoccus kandeliae TaxID=2073160 RepID=UPI00196B4229|nr:hypothetical protein [Acuticoccus kandeliae]
MSVSRAGIARMALAVCTILVVFGVAFGIDAIILAAGVIEIAGLLLVLPRLRKLTLAYVFGLVGASVALLLIFPGNLAGVTAGLKDAAVFAAFMASVIIMRNTVSRHPALAGMREEFGRIPANDRNGGIYVASHALGSVMTFGSLALMAPLFGADNTADQRRANALIILRSISLAVFWSPFTVAVAIVLQRMPELPAWMLVTAGVATVGVATLLGILRGEIRITPNSVTRVLSPILPILGPLLLPVAAIFVLPTLFGLSSLAAVALVLPVFCLGWLIVIDPSLVEPTVTLSVGQFDYVFDEVAFFTCSIMLADIIAHSPGLVTLVSDTLAIHDPSFIHFALAAIAIAVACSLGIHMVVPASIALAIIGPQVQGVGQQLGFAIMVLFAWCFGAMVTMSSVVMLSTANAFQVPVRQLIRSPNMSLMLTLGAIVFAVAAATGALT